MLLVTGTPFRSRLSPADSYATLCDGPNHSNVTNLIVRVEARTVVVLSSLRHLRSGYISEELHRCNIASLQPCNLRLSQFRPSTPQPLCPTPSVHYELDCQNRSTHRCCLIEPQTFPLRFYLRRIAQQ